MNPTHFQRFSAALLLLSILVGCSKEVEQAPATEHFRLRMYFGLSIPDGGVVTLDQWYNFQNEEIAKVFTGFNVVDSVGYYEGKPEHSKLVTVIGSAKELEQAKTLAASYSTQFQQDSVMMVTTPVMAWQFIGAGKSATSSASNNQ